MWLHLHLLVAACLATRYFLNETGGRTWAAAIVASTPAATECAEPTEASLSIMLFSAVTAVVPNASSYTGALANASVTTSVQPGEKQTCSELQNVAGFWQFRERALCPWYLVNETKDNRYPRTLTAARSVNVTGCGKCPTGRSCQGVKVEQTVLRYTGNCDKSHVKVYSPVKENVTVGFACVLNWAGN